MGPLSQSAYFFATAIASSGYFLGIVQSWISPEEMLSGKRYFRILQYLIIASAGLACLYYGSFIGAIVTAAVIFADYRRINHASYLLLGSIPLLTARNSALFSITLTLILIYGIVKGSLLYNDRDRYLKVSVSMLLFIIAANLYHLSSLILR